MALAPSQISGSYLKRPGPPCTCPARNMSRSGSFRRSPDLHCPCDHAQNRRPEREERQQTRTDRIRIGVRPESDLRQDDDGQQWTATEHEQPESDLEETIREVSV